MNLKGPKTEKDFENSLEFWREFGKMAKDEMKRLIAENEQLTQRIHYLEAKLEDLQDEFREYRWRE